MGNIHRASLLSFPKVKDCIEISSLARLSWLPHHDSCTALLTYTPRQVVDYCEGSYLEPGANKREVRTALSWSNQAGMAPSKLVAVCNTKSAHRLKYGAGLLDRMPMSSVEGGDGNRCRGVLYLVSCTRYVCIGSRARPGSDLDVHFAAALCWS